MSDQITNSEESEPAKPGSLKRVVRRIFVRLDEDIRDRRGLKHAWGAIDDDVMNEELRPAWENILTEEISRLLNAPNEGAEQPGAQPPVCSGNWFGPVGPGAIAGLQRLRSGPEGLNSDSTTKEG